MDYARSQHFFPVTVTISSQESGEWKGERGGENEGGEGGEGGEGEGGEGGEG